MKYTSPLLKKFISINDTPENIAKNLILKICEIEEVNHRTIAETIVIGYVKSCEKHPDADKLSVCQVNCGAKGDYQIICGGSNVTAGLYVPVALPGTYFPKIGITIEPRKMRGLESNGMICSKEEIGINEDMEKHWIWALAHKEQGAGSKSQEPVTCNLQPETDFDFDDISDEDLGKPLKEKYPWLEGWVMEVDNKSLTNRPDLTGHFGVATELNAIYGDVKGALTFNKVKEYHEQCTPEHIIQILENSTKPERKVVGKSEGLNAYLLLHLKNVNVQSASFFARLQTLDLGNNPISNWVDFSNLFMNISGQPIHFFDAEKVDGDIIVRNAKDGEKFKDLFESEHVLKATDVVITDSKKVLALAGVVGGLDSGITESTKNILVEIANFDPVAVRKTGTRLGLRTDAELRFEKNINPRYTLFCLILFLDDLNYYKKDLGNFEIGGLSYYISSKLEAQSSKHIEVDTKIMEQFIFGKKNKGFDKKVKDILTGLGFTGEFSTQHLTLNTPLWRGPDDLNIPEDIYEEIARIYGYDQIENIPLLSDMVYTPYTPYVAIQRQLEDILVRTIGCDQTETYPRISEKTLQEFGKDKETIYILQNPVNPESPYMRDDMIYGLLGHTAKNSKFFDICRIFDIGKIWNKTGTRNEGKGESKFASDFVDEETYLGVMLYQKNIDQWNKDPILEAKEIVKVIAKELKLGKILFEKTALAHYHPKKQATIKIGDLVMGFVGSLHPLILQNHKIGETSGVVYLSLNITAIIENTQETEKHIYTYETLQDQIIWRDLCFVVDANKGFDSVITAVKKVTEVQEVEVFDIYAGNNLGENKKSVSIKIKIIGDGNMTTEQINDVMKKTIAAAESAGGNLRG
ncbi:MAG: phenylalanine--tRNA ligase subunit beta [Candidatus Absconditabacterales bacterium]